MTPVSDSKTPQLKYPHDHYKNPFHRREILGKLQTRETQRQLQSHRQTKVSEHPRHAWEGDLTHRRGGR